MRRNLGRRDVVLLALYLFRRLGREEVSLVELFEAIKSFQERYRSLGYVFWERFLYSPELADDLNKLEPTYIKRITYTDDYLPKRYVKLSDFGLRYCEEVSTNLTGEMRVALERSVADAIRNHKELWRLWGRPPR